MILFLIIAVILLILLVFFVISWFIVVRIEIIFKREAGNDRSEIKVSALGGILRFHMKFPQLKWEGLGRGMGLKSEAEAESVATPDLNRQKRFRVTRQTIRKGKAVYRRMLRDIDDLFGTVRWFLSKVTCEKLEWRTTLGTGDAAEAGVLTGIAWGIKTTLVGVLGSYTRWDEPPRLSVDPAFHHAVLQTHFHSIIRFRLGHAILGIKRLLLHKRQGRERKWQTTPFRA
ncbi:DUF2953 domain-containing protein [Lihuaxuella thermophila]|uniref:DUF2953 domain-containing protein n=1 Tax=Lihuaxuella thermophila TaxID=1173111 RepID=UPI00147D0FF6|nr:DUF2953 domain-containing protein [Lihuaxuella thermophila]